jgi:hypothetical protein
MQHDIVGIALRADVKSVRVQVDRRGGQLLGIERNGLALGDVLRAVIIPDGEAGQAVVQMDDQLLAGKHLQGGRGVKVLARRLAIGCRAADQLIVEEQEILDGRRHRIERGRALSRGEPDFEDATLGRERHRFLEVGSNGRIEGGARALRLGRGEHRHSGDDAG